MRFSTNTTGAKYNFQPKSVVSGNHLGNVLTVVSDRKLAHTTTPISGIIDYYNSEIISANDYYAFGAPMPGRKFVSGQKYRYGYQNQEEDPEFWNGAVTFEYRVEDPRLGRFFSVDPLFKKYAYNSPYAFAENRVIDGRELEGLEWEDADQGVSNEDLDQSDRVFPTASQGVIDRQISFNLKNIQDNASPNYKEFIADKSTEFTFLTVNEKDSDNNSDLKNVNLNTDGEPNSASFDLNLSTNQTLIAKNHNHPENSPPSSTDIRSMIGSNSGTSSFVYGKGGNTYALVVTNATKATAFLTKYSDEDIYIMIINRAAIIINEIGSYDDFNPIYEKATQGILSGNGLELFKEGSGGYFQKSQ